MLVQHETVTRGWYKWGLVWDKEHATFGRADYQPQHEPIVYGWKPGGAHRPVADRKHRSVIQHPRPSASKAHPTMKPIELLRQLLAAHEFPPGTIVLEPFAGPGSTLIAAHQEGLICHAVEYEPAYCDVILERWREATGVEPTLLT